MSHIVGWKLATQILDQFQKYDLSDSELKVYLALCSYAGDDGRCYPSIATLAQRTRMSASTVRRSIRRLEHHRLVVTIQLGDRGKSNVYLLTVMTGEGSHSYDRGGSHSYDWGGSHSSDRITEPVTKPSNETIERSHESLETPRNFLTDVPVDDPGWYEEFQERLKALESNP